MLRNERLIWLQAIAAPARRYPLKAVKRARLNDGELPAHLPCALHYNAARGRYEVYSADQCLLGLLPRRADADAGLEHGEAFLSAAKRRFGLGAQGEVTVYGTDS